MKEVMIFLMAVSSFGSFASSNQFKEIQIKNDSFSLKNQLKKTDVHLGLGFTQTRRYGSYLGHVKNMGIRQTIWLI